MGQRAAGDDMFAAYLHEQGYGDVEHEPDLGVGKFPDFVIERLSERCVVEVKEFAATSSPFPTDQRAFSSSPAVMLKPVRGQLHEGARKLKSMVGLGLPLVVMLTNPHGIMLELDPQSVLIAMYGDPTATFPVAFTPEPVAGSPDVAFGRNGRYRGDHAHVSAVGILGRLGGRTDYRNYLVATGRTLRDADDQADAAVARGELEADRHNVTLIHTASTNATPVPDCFFDGPDARVFALDPSGERYQQTRGG